MTLPKRVDAYPASMLDALSRAVSLGHLLIPCPPERGITPSALRLRFYGLFHALRAENKPEFPAALTLRLQANPPGLLLQLRDKDPLGSLVSDSLSTPPSAEPLASESAPDPLEAAFRRILGDSPDV